MQGEAQTRTVAFAHLVNIIPTACGSDPAIKRGTGDPPRRGNSSSPQGAPWRKKKRERWLMEMSQCWVEVLGGALKTTPRPTSSRSLAAGGQFPGAPTASHLQHLPVPPSSLPGDAGQLMPLGRHSTRWWTHALASSPASVGRGPG